MKVKTRVGELDVPEPKDIGPRTKYWVEALTDLVRLEELQGVVAKMLLEAYETGRIQGIMAGFDKRTQGEIIDVEWREIPSEEKRSPMEGSGKALEQQGELERAESLGSCLQEAPLLGPLDQADGATGGETRVS